MTRVNNKIESRTIEPRPEERPDPWADFRQVELIELEWTQTYRHSLGKYSRFFLELENGRFLATRCPACSKVWTPPRPLCPDCLEITEWTELPGTGTLAAFSVLHYAPAMMSDLETPYVLAYVKLDGADTLFAHLLQNWTSLEEIRIGMRVRVAYSQTPVDHPIRLMVFEPLEEKS